jgi:hypothetical protein
MHRERKSSTTELPIPKSLDTRATSQTRLRRGLLNLARALWIIFALSNLVSLPFGIQTYYNQILASGRSVPAVARALTQMHLTAAQEAVSFTVIFGLASLVFLVIGALIFWRLWGTSTELLGLLTSFIFVTIALTGITGVFEGASASPNPFLLLAFTISGISFFVLFPCLAAFLLTFPNGRFAPRWSWLLILLWLGQFAFFIVVSTGVFGSASDTLLVVVVLLTWGSTLSMQVYRYARVYTYSERQQTKWLIFGLASGLLLTAGSTITGNLLPQLSRPDSPYQLIMNNLGGLIVFLPLSLSIGVALLRYRLWNIDLIINRTLVYGTLTLILSAVYVGLIIGLQALLRGVINQDNSIAIVISTLAIAALFQPLRHRLQKIIDRRFYRSKYNAAKVIEAFGTTIRNEVDLTQLSEHLVTVVEETMQPVRVSLWLRQPTQMATSALQVGKPFPEEARGQEGSAENAVGILSQFNRSVPE